MEIKGTAVAAIRDFVKASSPWFIVQRASRIFSTYYRPCEMVIASTFENGVLLRISDMTESDEVIEYRIAGWIQKALEISGAKKTSITFPKSVTKGDSVTEIDIRWD
jgi:hypothetical protein